MFKGFAAVDGIFPHSMQLPIASIRSFPAATGMETGPRSIEAVKVLRISVTDRCNFRCLYCMPEEGVEWLSKDKILSFAEIVDVVRSAVTHYGISRFKLTGGEPTVRADLPLLARMIRQVPGVTDLSITTNGFALESLAVPLRDAGIDRVTISIDSLKPDRFRTITRTGDLAKVLRGLETCERAGFTAVKINCVTMRGTNDDEFADFARLSIDRRVTVRFIEYMPLGDAQLLADGNPFMQATSPDGATFFQSRNRTVAAAEIGPAGGCGSQLRGDVFVPENDVRRSIESALGELEPVDRATEPGVGPAVIYRLVRHDARGRIGFISAMSQPFCSTCNRLRLTADGVLRSCLFDGGEIDVRPILRGTQVDRSQKLAAAMADCVRLKPQVHSLHGNEQMSRIGG